MTASLAVSVVIPARNAAGTIVEAIASIWAAARRCPRVEVEVIVVDDGSADPTAAAAESAGVDRVILRAEPGGPAAARNEGVAASTGGLLAFLDADDLWTADRLDPLLAELGRSAGAVGACRFVDLTADERNHLGWRTVGDPVAVVPSLGAAVFRREAWTSVGPLDPTLSSHEDLDLFLRIGDAGLGMATVSHVVTTVRARPGSLSRMVPGAPGQRRVLARSARRRRETSADEVVRPRWGPVQEVATQ